MKCMTENLQLNVSDVYAVVLLERLQVEKINKGRTSLTTRIARNYLKSKKQVILKRKKGDG